MKIIRVTRSDGLVWSVMPQILHRVGEFCRVFDTDTQPQEATDIVTAWFCQGDSQLAMWVAVDGGEIVGHVWVTVEPMGSAKPRYVLIRQAYVNPGINIRSETKEVFDEVKLWTKSLGLSTVIMLTHRDAAAMARRWGFKPFKMFMKFEVN